MGEAFNAMTRMAHPYHWEVIGWPSDIAQVTREQANEFFATYYAPNNLTAILVGDFNPDQALALAEKYLGRIPANPKGVPEVITQEPAQPAEQRMVAELETTPGIEVVFKAVPAVHQDAPALQALGGILGGAQMFGGRPGAGGGNRPPTGRLSKSLVLDKKVATNAAAMFRGQKYGGLFTLRATPAQGQTPEALEPLLYAEVDRIVREGVTEEELQRFKNATQVGYYTRLESHTGIRETLAQALATGTVQDFQEGPKRIQAVTREDVRRVARQYLVKDSRSVLLTHRKGTESGAAARPGGNPQAMLARIQEMADPAQLRALLERMKGQLAEAPPERKPAVEAAVKAIQERIQKLEGK